MNWIAALQNFCRQFPPGPGLRFSWLLMEKQIQKTLGVQQAVFAMRQGDELLRDSGKTAFSSSETVEVLRHFDRKPEPWILTKKNSGNWLGFWPVKTNGEWTACIGLSPKKKGGRLSGEEMNFMKLAVDRTALFLETGRLWKALELADRHSAVGFMSLAMAHEIRNPLTAMGALVELLPRKKDNLGFMDDFQKVMNREIIHLTHLTESFLSYSKDGPKKSEPVELHKIVLQVTQLIKPLFAMKESRLGVKNSGNLFVTGDEHQLQCLIMNLLQNALQSAGHGGTVHISTGVPQRKSGGKWIEINVKDDGPGILPENFNKIFDPYFSTKSSGSGLGLAICRKIVEEHGGLLTVKSASRKGAHFNVLLPAAIKT